MREQRADAAGAYGGCAPPSTCLRPAPGSSAGATAAAPAPSGLEVERLTRPEGGMGLSLGVRPGGGEWSCIVGSFHDPRTVAGYRGAGTPLEPQCPEPQASPLSHRDTCSPP